MALAKINQVTGSAIHVPGDDIDTDRIIPARFMKCVTFDGLGEYLFHDVRFDADGNKKPHSLNDEKFSEASIMLSGKNFGCGSSREHAPQSLYRAGFRAIIAGNFAEIFLIFSLSSFLRFSGSARKFPSLSSFPGTAKNRMLINYLKN